MEHLPNKKDEQVVTFDLCEIFDETNAQMEQIDADYIPDEILREILEVPIQDISNFNENKNESDLKADNKQTNTKIK